ncbi:MAG: NADH-quinone oxidoreductase subunit C [Actinomycetota bacterium]
MRLEATDALDRVKGALGERVNDVHLNHGQVDVTVEAGNLVEVVRILRDDIALGCRFFTFLSAVDRSTYDYDDEEKRETGSAGSQNNRGGIEVLVHLYSPEKIWHVNLHIPLDFGTPVCPSITGVFKGAEWHERETGEMFGIHFTDHPNLVTLYLPEDFEGHPMLKSFKLPARSYVKDWPGAKDPDEAAAGGR